MNALQKTSWWDVALNWPLPLASVCLFIATLVFIPDLFGPEDWLTGGIAIAFCLIGLRRAHNRRQRHLGKGRGRALAVRNTPYPVRASGAGGGGNGGGSNPPPDSPDETDGSGEPAPAGRPLNQFGGYVPPEAGMVARVMTEAFVNERIAANAVVARSQALQGMVNELIERVQRLEAPSPATQPVARPLASRKRPRRYVWLVGTGIVLLVILVVSALFRNAEPRDLKSTVPSPTSMMPTAPANATPAFGAPVTGVPVAPAGAADAPIAPTVFVPGVYVYPGYDKAGGKGLYNWLAAQFVCTADSEKADGLFAPFYRRDVAPAYGSAYKENPQASIQVIVTAPEMANGCK